MTKLYKLPRIAIGDLVEKVSRPVSVEPETHYRQIGVRSHGRGLFDKEAVTGASLGNKRVFWIEPDCFVVNIVFAWEQAIGRTTEADVGKIASHRFPMYRPLPEKADLNYLVYFFNTSYGKHLLSLASPGGAGRNKTLGQSNFLELEIPVPPIEEQRRIAEIFGTWDRAIDTTEKLIEASEAQKKALMQQLLTGQKRLPGFEGEWREVWLKEIAEVIVSNVDKKSVEGETEVRLCNYTDVYSRDQIDADQEFMHSTASLKQIKRFALKVGDVVITKDSERPDDIAVPSVVASTASDLLCGYHLAIVRPRPGEHGPFLKYLFESPITQNYFATRANGATRFGLTLDAIEQAPLRAPKLEEQKAIAGLLASAESEARLLTQKLQALKAEKAALMQQLLTGKRRVNVKDMAA